MDLREHMRERAHREIARSEKRCHGISTLFKYALHGRCKVTYRITTVLLSAALMAAGCGESQLDNKPRAAIEEARPDKAEAPPEQAPAPATTRAEPPRAKPASKDTPPKAPDAPATETKERAKKQVAPKGPDPLEKAERALVLDTRRSTAAFVGRKVTKDHEGSFEAFSGKARLKGYMPESLELTIETGSVTTDHPDLTNHLKSADFFHTAKYPKARFVSTPSADEGRPRDDVRDP